MQINLNIDKKIFNEAYLPMLNDYDTRYNVFFGGAGSGKSHFVFQKCVIKSLRSRRKFLVIRKVGSTLKDSVWQMCLDTLSTFGVRQYCKINKSDFTIELPNKSVFLFKGLDDPEKIKSIAGITDIIIEEATELTYDDFTQLNLRLRARVNHLQIHLMFNPVSKANWCYKHWFQYEDLQHMLSTNVLHTTYKDNKFLTKEYIASLEQMKETNYTYYKIYALGEFASLNKLVFENWKVEDFNHKNIQGDYIFGIDFGYINDPTAIMLSKVSGNKLYIYSEHVEKGMLNNEIAKCLKNLGIHKELIIADSAEQKSIDEIKRYGVPRIKEAVKGPGSVLQGIQKLQQYEIIIHPSCKNTIEEFNNYSWKKDKSTNEYINTPVDTFNHCIDSLRYSIQGLDRGKLQTMNKLKFSL